MFIETFINIYFFLLRHHSIFGKWLCIYKNILSAIVDVPKELINKTFLIDINDRWNNLTPVQKDMFMNLFSSESYQPLSKIVIYFLTPPEQWFI